MLSSGVGIVVVVLALAAGCADPDSAELLDADRLSDSDELADGHAEPDWLTGTFAARTVEGTWSCQEIEEGDSEPRAELEEERRRILGDS